jgi:hypothetical protein
MTTIDSDRLATANMPPACQHGSWVCAVAACIIARMRLDRAFTERVAHFAAFHGDSALEITCDEAAAGITKISILRAMVDLDPKLQAWCMR